MEIPMPVILIGAIGGMLRGGVIGLFVGAVVLAIGYKLFTAWMKPIGCCVRIRLPGNSSSTAAGAIRCSIPISSGIQCRPRKCRMTPQITPS